MEERVLIKGREINPHKKYSHKPSHIFHSPFCNAQEKEKIRKISNFLWESRSEDRKLHLMNWRTICKIR